MRTETVGMPLDLRTACLSRTADGSASSIAEIARFTAHYLFEVHPSKPGPAALKRGQAPRDPVNFAHSLKVSLGTSPLFQQAARMLAPMRSGPSGPRGAPEAFRLTTSAGASYRKQQEFATGRRFCDVVRDGYPHIPFASDDSRSQALPGNALASRPRLVFRRVTAKL